MNREERKQAISDAVDRFRLAGIKQDTADVVEFQDLLMQATRDELDSILTEIIGDNKNLMHVVYWAILHTLDMDNALRIIYDNNLAPKAEKAIQEETAALHEINGKLNLDLHIARQEATRIPVLEKEIARLTKVIEHKDRSWRNMIDVNKDTQDRLDAMRHKYSILQEVVDTELDAVMQ